MGVIYKLKPEIINFIIEEKRTNSIISCRGITTLVEKKFQFKVSKSSINSIIKKQGLSLPVGRRQKKKRQTEPVVYQPVIALEPITLVPVIPEQISKIEEHVEPQQVIEPAAVIPEPVFKIEEPIVFQPIIEPTPVIPESVAPEPVASEPVMPEPVILEPIISQPVIPEPTFKIEELIDTTGVILLKAVDYLIGGSYSFAQAISSRLNRKDTDCLAKIEKLIYMPLFDHFEQPINDYLNELQSVKAISLDLLRITSTLLQEVRCLKVSLSDGGTMYLDGQLHTIWSTPHIPPEFSTTTYDVRSYINKYFYGNSPFVLFMAPGYDMPSKEFFNFILSLHSKSKNITKLTLYDNNFEELEEIPLNLMKSKPFAFGLWPWQFVEYRKVKKIGEFKPFNAELLNKEIYTADIEIELTQPNINQSVTFKGSAIKTSLTEKTRLIILTNFADEEVSPSLWLNSYLSHWPNFEEAFHDYNRKIELFTYTGASRTFFSREMLGLGQKAPLDLKTIFNKYLEALDLYIRWHFLPAGYENKDFPTTKENFYNLKIGLNKVNDKIFVTFRPAPDYQFLKDLEYACRRLNERGIFSPGEIRLWFSV